MDAYSTLYTAGGIPALVSTAVTIIYFTIKLIAYFLNASTRETESGQRMLHYSISRHNQGATSGTEGTGEVYEDLSGDPFEKDNNGRRQRPRSPRTILLQTERTNVLVPPERDFTGNKTMPPLPTNVEGCGSRRSANTTDNISQGPQGPYPDTPGISAEGRGRQDATDKQPQYCEGIGREG